MSANPAYLDILKAADSEGVGLTLSAEGRLTATGDRERVNRWLPLIRDHKAEILEALSRKASEWLVHYREGSQRFVASPPATRAEVMAWNPGAVGVEPYARPAEAMALDPLEEESLRRWLGRIGERDPEIVRAVLSQVRRDQEARRFFLSKARA